MKAIVASAALLAAATLGVYAQGTVIANNNSSSYILNTDGTRAATTLPIWIGLFYNTDTTALPNPVTGDDWLLSSPPVGVYFLGAGLFQMGTRTIPGTIGTQKVLFQVRAWDKAFENTAAGYTAAVNSGNPNARIGYQTVGNNANGTMLLSLGEGSLAAPPITGTAANQGGFTGFQLQFAGIIPEPSVLALGILGGLGTLVLIRRRR